PVVVNGLVFLAPNEGLGVCLDAATGKELWRERLGEQFRATPLVVGDKVCFVSKECKVTVVEASREFKVVGQIEFNEDTVASPAVAGRDLFIRAKGHLYRIGGNVAAKK